MIDAEGYRKNVGIVLLNQRNRVFWCKRIGQNAWQFPQGGINADETPEDAMFRELQEETGLLAHHIDILGRTRDWLRYDLPEQFQRKNTPIRCIGQKQIWFLLRFRGLSYDVNLFNNKSPEFDDWCWLEYEKAAEKVIFFKREVYAKALDELRHFLV